MSRPKICRKTGFSPKTTYFKPSGIPASMLEKIVLEPDELEALKLCDAEELSQGEAADKMNISQPTLNRILASARNKIAKAIIEGKAISIEK